MPEAGWCARSVIITWRAVQHVAGAMWVVSRRMVVQWLKSLFGAGPKRGGPRPKPNEKSTASGVPVLVMGSTVISSVFINIQYSAADGLGPLSDRPGDSESELKRAALSGLVVMLQHRLTSPAVRSQTASWPAARRGTRRAWRPGGCSAPTRGYSWGCATLCSHCDGLLMGYWLADRGEGGREPCSRCLAMSDRVKSNSEQ